MHALSCLLTPGHAQAQGWDLEGVHSATGNAKNHRKTQMLWVNSNDQTKEPVPPENHCGKALACHSVNVSWQAVKKITDYGF